MRKNRDVLLAVLAVIGRKRLRELSTAEVHAALASAAATRSTSTVAVAHNCLTRLIRYDEARDLVRRNVSALVDTPKGQPGRRSRSLTLDQAVALRAWNSEGGRCRQRSRGTAGRVSRSGRAWKGMFPP